VLKKIALLLIFITWPISLFLANTPSDFLKYFIPGILILISYFTYKKKLQFYFVPLFFIPFIEPKLAILPFIFLLINFNKKNILPLIISVVLLIVFVKPFFGQTIFITDRDSKQELIEKGNLYNSVFLARLFQNKARIPIDKFTNNFFAITDPGNYFFGFAPRQITIDNQNLKKFPFLTLPLILIGLYFISKNKNKKFVITILVASIINLGLLTNFDRSDFILWIPLFLLIVDGINYLPQHNIAMRIFLNLLPIFSTIEIIRILIK
jgi:hypothetical protein